MNRWKLSLFCLIGSLVGLAGCGGKPPSFADNRLYALKLQRELAAEDPVDAEQTGQILRPLFGSPNDPRWPESDTSPDKRDPLVTLANLQRAGGAVKSDRSGTHTGLYREHCANCHGVSGNGIGPAASFMNPYPRDFRMGVFKFKSTPRGAKPTRDDLMRTLLEGMPGSSMPSFRLLPEEDLVALVDYVIYLSVRGELERRLLWLGASEGVAMPTERDVTDWISQQASNPSEVKPQVTPVVEELNQLIGKWRDAESQRISPPQAIVDLDTNALWRSDPDAYSKALAHGRELFTGKVANCAACHGPSGDGRVVTKDYDEWTKEWTTRIGISPDDRSAYKPLLRAGALPPRPIVVRNLTLGAFHGGARPIDLYHRLTQGIEGTSMPAVNVAEQGSDVALGEKDLRDLILYVSQLAKGAH